MSSGTGTAFANQILDHVLGGPPYTPLANVYLALYNVVPSAGGVGGVEVSAPGYGRKLIVNDSSQWSSAGSASKYNLNTLTFSGAGVPWGVIVGASLMDSGSGGNVLVWGTLQEAKSIYIGDIATFPAGSITVTLL